MKFFALLAVASALTMTQAPAKKHAAKRVSKKAKPAVARSYNKRSEVVSSGFYVENDDVLEHPYNAIDSGFVQTFPEYDGWKEADKPDAAVNTCVNVNKASGVEEPCSTIGNSAWNTLTSAKTDSQTTALDAPYPLHQYHLDAEAARTAF